MPTMIFVNLPVNDLQRSKDFFTALGYSFNEQFTDENAACLIIREDAIFAMLLTRDFFSRFTKKPIADATSSTEAILALSADSREAVDALVDKALTNGGSPSNETDDQGYMYSRSFQDPDGHLWEVLYMDEAAMQEAMQQQASADAAPPQ
ncbi:MAG: glyoxalase [Cryobacterium sp.]|jgi:predicted lactoylglutathione lyase|nr:glyoxalase [Cryobacterium sp.]